MRGRTHPAACPSARMSHLADAGAEAGAEPVSLGNLLSHTEEESM